MDVLVGADPTGYDEVKLMGDNFKDPFCSPFAGLSARIKARRWRLVDLGAPSEVVEKLPDDADQLDDETLFLQVVADAQPIEHRHHIDETPSAPPRTTITESEDDAQAVLRQLNDLIRDGSGFVVSDTPEFISGRVPGVAAGIAQRLHSGAFSIQAHIDLHGMTRFEACGVVDHFLAEAIRRGHRAVLIVHGRGLSSQGPPVLKRQVVHWFTRGRWRKYVIAFASARLCDGGAGATYVLLRQWRRTGRAKPL
jgi:DNA-nicking Smr family endonuclease